MTVKVKICGVTRLEDALAAAGSGADFLGFNHYDRSPRRIAPEAAAEIVAVVRQAHPTVRMVGVFVDHGMEKIWFLMSECDYDYAQLSGDEDPAFLAGLGDRAFKAIRPGTIEQARVLASAYGNRSARPALLLDALVDGLYGGTGARADLDLAAELARDWDLMLAGGLNPDNVAEAVRLVHPWAVDVASGVEVSPGVKDHAKLRRFIENAKTITTEITEHTEIF